MPANPDMATQVSFAQAEDFPEPLLTPALKLDVAELLVAYLEQLGVEYVFGVPGGAIEPIYNALACSARLGGPRPVLARHETGAAFMADGYARETGRLAVCCGTSGPGSTNLITGVACAYDNGIPMLVLTGQPMLPAFGKGALQESACTGINTLAMFQHCTRYNSMVSHPEQLEAKLAAALSRAMHGPRGPVHLSFPVDILRSTSSRRAASYDLCNLLQPRAMIDEAALEALTHAVKGARNIVMLVGGGCGEAVATILQFAAQVGATLVATPDGKGLLPPRHPLLRGVFGFAGHASADAALRDASVDLIIAIGTSLGEWTSAGWSDAVLNHRLIHIDESDDHLARSPMARLHVRGRILTVFERLCAQQSAIGVRQRTIATRARVPELERCVDDKSASDAAPILPQRLMRDLGRLFPANTRYLADAGNSVAWAIHCLVPDDRHRGVRGLSCVQRADLSERRTSAGGWLRVTMEFAPMGWAIGGAIGTAMATSTDSPGAPVVCITGDGSMLMNGQELSVAVAEKLNVIFVVLNDASLGMVKHGQRMAGAEAVAHDLPRTDFAALARALGADGFTISSPEALNALDFDAICSRAGPTLIDVHIDGEEVPPINLRMKMLGTGK